MQTAVLVAGAGPVGLTMAAELARHDMGLRLIIPATIGRTPTRRDRIRALATRYVPASGHAKLTPPLRLHLAPAK